MARASKFFDKSGGAASGNKQDAVNGAAMTIMKLLVQSKFSGTSDGSNSGGLGSLMGLARSAEVEDITGAGPLSRILDPLVHQGEPRSTASLLDRLDTRLTRPVPQPDFVKNEYGGSLDVMRPIGNNAPCTSLSLLRFSHASGFFLVIFRDTESQKIVASRHANPLDSAGRLRRPLSSP
ncbi:uncharacterized protein BXZ73DRAFT_73803 [Epithele typhae]|uniref:uncharacterized protein n=1 Tax=Epithele typhae TaxID=378194 RepID=UPI00200792B4|nr:uncharacterized protein BXZ73DRAFT_73803 [Epithele typhae]KAH9944236.1 hypothetical protein BXZ73DRAFT_73803 [Epithele typhae]